MKKLIYILVFMLSFAVSSKAQHNNYRHSHKYSSHASYDDSPRMGLCITGSGVTFTLAGFLTAPDYMWVQTSPTSGGWNKKPFMQQGARSACIITGFTLTATGLITMLSGN